MTKKTQLEAIVDIRKKLNEATASVTARDLIEALKNTNSAGSFNFNEYIGRKNPDNYDGVDSDIIYWYLVLPGNTKWTFSVCADEVTAHELVELLNNNEDFTEDFLNTPIEDIGGSDIIDVNGTISEPGHLSEKQIWKKIWE